MEAPDIADWLKGGEMLLTSLYPIRNYTEEEQREFVSRLADKGVSALMIKNHRFVKKSRMLSWKQARNQICLSSRFPKTFLMWTCFIRLWKSCLIIR
ncbi:PucR family transcriptional regulator ligand-binding domain-containing protein [Brevibacillus laterosporus]